MTQTHHPNPASPPGSRLDALLARPAADRLREFKYRFSQSVVFGLPVIALEFWGRSLGGVEAERWVGILQALLAGWVVYVGALGMLLEGAIVRKGWLLADAMVGLFALAAYLASLVSLSHVVVDGRVWYRPLLFHVAVMLLCLWTALQWFRWGRRVRRGGVGVLDQTMPVPQTRASE